VATKPDVLYLHLLRDIKAFVSETQMARLLDESKCTHETDESARVYAAVALCNSLLKKYVSSSSEADAAALQIFMQSNQQCMKAGFVADNMTDSLLLGGVKQSCWRFFSRVCDELSFGKLFAEGNLGPGVNIGSKGASDLYTKLFNSTLTATNTSLVMAYDHYTSLIPTWAAAEIQRKAEYGLTEIVGGSKVSFAPKDAKVSRLICPEPTLNMFFQLGLGKVLERHIRGVFGINLETQQFVNRRLARVGSTNGRYATLDLKSASDSVSLKLLELLAPGEFVAWVDLLRSPATQVNGEWVDLHMVSTMGNGFTFPLQTAIFCCVVDAVYRYRNRKPVSTHSGRNFGVFGDDIIVAADCYDDVCRLLELLGFTVNHDKSFSDGYFRESCGGDYYRGRFVRGVYCRSLRSPQDIYSLINRLVRWSALNNIPLYSTLGYLSENVRRIFVPRDEQDTAGIKVPLSLVDSFYRTRGGTKPWHSSGFIAYKRWFPRKKVLRVNDEAERISTPKGQRRRSYNQNGLLTALLQGSLRALTINVRLDVTCFQLKMGTTSNWDRYPPQGVDELDPRGWHRWEAMSFVAFYK
jgi:hypothetical protein